MKHFFYTFLSVSLIYANLSFADTQPSEHISPERIREDLDRLEKYVHKKLGLNDLEHPTGTPVEKIEADSKTSESMYDKGQLSHIHTKLEDQNSLVADLMDRIERLERQDHLFSKEREEKESEIKKLKEHIVSLQEQLDLAVLEIEKLRATSQRNPAEKTEEAKEGSDKTQKESTEEDAKEKESAPPVLATEADIEIDLDNKTPDEIFAMAEKHLGAADYKTAKIIFEFYTNMDIKNAEKAKAHYYLGEIYKLTDQTSSASEHYLKAFQLNSGSPQAPESLIKLGICLHEGGKAKAGCSALCKAKSEYPKMVGAQKSLLDKKFREFKCPAK